MILNNKQVTVITEGEELENVKMEIDDDPESLQFLMQSISNLYSDPVGSCIREYCSNALDSHVEATTKDPILVNLYSENGNWLFSVEDFGIGINQDTIDNILKKYGKSTKRTSNDVLGCFGWGSKSAWAYSTHFYIIGRKDGVEGKWLLRKGEEGNEIDTIYTKETTEKNGAKVIIPVKRYDQSAWSSKIREQLAYFKGVYITDEYSSFDNNFKIFENDLFKYSAVQPDDKLHICLGDVYYPLDFAKLGLSDIYLPVALNFKLDDGIEPVPSRENLKLPNETKDKIKQRIKDVADWMVKHHNSNTVEYSTWGEGRLYIEQKDIYVDLRGENVRINDIISFSDEKIIPVSIKGFNNAHLEALFKRERQIIEYHYIVAGEFIWNGSFKSKCYFAPSYNKYDKYILLNQTPVGNLREYLKEKYKNAKCIKYYNEKRKLIARNSSGQVSYSDYAEKNCYYNILQLHKFDKKEWREWIKEAQLMEKDFFESKVEDLRELEVPQDWLDNRKKQLISVGKYTVLNKQEGEVTIAWAEKKQYENNYKFNKSTKEIKALKSLKGLVIYGDESQKEKLNVIKRWFKSCDSPYTTAIIGPREAKKIEHLNQFKTIKQFMEGNLIKKFITANKAEQVVRSLRIMFGNDHITVLKALSGKYEGIYKDLSEYVRKYKTEDVASTSLGRELLEYGEKNKIFDEIKQPEVDSLQKFSESVKFVSYLKIPDSRFSWESEKGYENRIKNFLNIMHKMLIFEKVCKNNFEDWTLCPPVINSQEKQIENEVF